MLINAVAQALALAAAAPSHPSPPVTDTIVVGHSSLRVPGPRIGVDTIELYAERNGQRQLVATEIQSVSRVADSLLVVYTTQSRGGNSIDSVTVLAQTFAPVRHVEILPERRATYRFHAGRLVGTSTDSTGDHVVDVPAASNLLDFSVLHQITGVLPLATAYAAVIMTYDVSVQKQRPVEFRVIGQEQITWHATDVVAWRTVADFGTHTVTRWIDARTRRELQWEITMPNTHMTGVTK
jgi:hypothetical protein